MYFHCNNCSQYSITKACDDSIVSVVFNSNQVVAAAAQNFISTNKGGCLHSGEVFSGGEFWCNTFDDMKNKILWTFLETDNLLAS